MLRKYFLCQLIIIHKNIFHDTEANVFFFCVKSNVSHYLMWSYKAHEAWIGTMLSGIQEHSSLWLWVCGWSARKQDGVHHSACGWRPWCMASFREPSHLKARHKSIGLIFLGDGGGGAQISAENWKTDVTLLLSHCHVKNRDNTKWLL